MAKALAMTAPCFCRCGRKIPRFPVGIGALNKRGRQVEERLAYVQACLGAYIDESWEREGQWITKTLGDLMHRDIDRVQFDSMLDEPAVRRWQTYGRQMEPLLVEGGYPPISTWLRTWVAGGGREALEDEHAGDLPATREAT